VGGYKQWERDEKMVMRAFGIGLYFSLPGIMTLVSLVDPASPRLWEWTCAMLFLGVNVAWLLLFPLTTRTSAATGDARSLL
jgi:hypothetical protein